MMENLRLEHGKGCFLFFLFVSKGEHEAAGPIAYEYLLHTWGGSAGRGEELEPERGARGGRGAGERRSRSEAAAGTVRAVPAYTFAPPLPFTGAVRVPGPAHYFPSPPLDRSGN